MPAAVTKIPQLAGLNGRALSQAPGGWKSEVGAPAWLGPGEDSRPVCKLPPPRCALSRWREGERVGPLPPLVRRLVSSWGSILMTESPPKGPHLSTLPHWGLSVCVWAGVRGGTAKVFWEQLHPLSYGFSVMFLCYGSRDEFLQQRLQGQPSGSSRRACRPLSARGIRWIFNGTEATAIH